MPQCVGDVDLTGACAKPGSSQMRV